MTMENVINIADVGSTFVIALFTICLWWSTRKLWKSSEKQLVSTQRAFVFLDDFKTDIRNLAEKPFFITRFTLKPRWRNSGNTPTKNMVVSVNYGESRGNLPPKLTYLKQPQPMLIGPNASDLSEMIEIPPGIITGVINDGIGSENNIFVWGRADYGDIFIDNRLHFTEWCYRLALSSKDGKAIDVDFIQCGPHNRAETTG